MKSLTRIGKIFIFLCLMAFIFSGCVGYGAATSPEQEEETLYTYTEEDAADTTEDSITDTAPGESDDTELNIADAVEDDTDDTNAAEEDINEAVSGDITEEDEANQEEDLEEINMEHTSSNGNNPIATITMENGGQIIIELFPEVAPNTVNNFIYLANSGFYDGLIFHRVIPGFMIQGGCPDGTGGGSPGHTIFGEFGANGFENNLSHTRGVISMARTPVFDSAGSQFFICVGDPTFLDNEYAGFGMVIQGMDVADTIVNQPRNRADRPDTDQRIATITVDTRGATFPEPEKLPGR